MVYYTIFRHALVDPNLAVRFPKSDLDIIRDLPSHNDAKFTNHARDSLAEACSKIENINGNDLRSAQSMAAHFEAAKSQIRNQLNEHYEAVLLELSDRGRDVVQSEVIRLSYNNAISSTDFDLTILGKESPKRASMFINQSCENAMHAPRLNESKSITIREEIAEAVNNGSVTFAPHSIQ